MINIRVTSKRKRDCLKHFYSYPDGRLTGGGEGMRKNEVSRSFSGWLSDIITAGPSLVVFWLVPFPHIPLFISRVLFLSLSLSFSSRYEDPLLSSLVFRLTALSLSVPAGLRGQRGEISDQFFKPRVPRLYTSWETTLGWAPVQLETSVATRGLVLRLGVEAGGEGEIKPRRKLKRGTEGSWKDRGQDAHAPPSTSLPSAPLTLNSLSLSLFSSRCTRLLLHQSSPPSPTSKCESPLSLPDFFSLVESTSCENDPIAPRLVFGHSLSTFFRRLLRFHAFFHAYISI